MEQTKIHKVFYDDTAGEAALLKINIQERDEQIASLMFNSDKQINTINNLSAELDRLEEINKSLTCVYENTQKFILNIRAIYVNENDEWISLKWYNVGKWVRLGKITFIFVKTTLADCFNITFKPRKMTWLGELINQIK